ncbi:type II secretion system protein [Candidatus Jorgensenbacteria bacterium]|nr:type II secretion system protein [Candidatus Jorgensenbacteria bacterium]
MKRGFTLIELLVVIAILVVLSTAVVLVLNPVELIKQSRDAVRISDLAAIKSAIALFAVDLTNPTALQWQASTTCTVSNFFPDTFPRSCIFVSSTAVDGTGWVRVAFDAISSKSPLSRLPLDPLNTVAGCSDNDGCYYAWAASTTVGVYEIDANMESNKYSEGGLADVESKDEGSMENWYEVGTKLDS